MKYCIIFTAFVLLCSWSCDKKNPTGSSGNDILGKWVLVKEEEEWTEDGVVYTDSEIFPTEDTSELYLLIITPELIISFANNGDETYECDTTTYTVKEKTIIMVYLDENGVEVYDTLDFYLTGGQLVFEMREVTGDDYEIYRIYLSKYTGVIPPPCWLIPIEDDDYEPDNDYTSATAIGTGGTSQNHTLMENDEDWLSFDAVSGNTYVIKTTGNTDTYLELYGTDGTTLLDDDDDDDDETGLSSGMNAVIVWVCATNGTYYFKVRGFSSDEIGKYAVSVAQSRLGSRETPLRNNTKRVRKFNRGLFKVRKEK